jgi:hypothetical protein
VQTHPQDRARIERHNHDGDIKLVWGKTLFLHINSTLLDDAVERDGSRKKSSSKRLAYGFSMY